jgi:dynein assembly factor 5
MQAIVPNLSHQHSKVRLAALSGLRELVLSGLPAGLLDSQVAPAVKPLTFDHTASVREAHYAALAAWLGCSQQQQQNQQQQQAGDGHAEAAAAAGAAHARCRTYAPVLLPLLLLGVTDPQGSIAAATLRAVEQAGDIWQAQPATAAAAVAAGSSEAVPMETDTSADPAAAAAAVPSAESLAVSPAAVAAAQLLLPYQGLPSLPSRQMVAALLPQLLPLVASGLREWTVSLRSAAARLLHTSLVLAGPAVTPFLPQLLPGLINALSDDDADTVTLLAVGCRLLGAFVPSPSWLPLLVDAVSDSRSGPGSKANTLVVLSCLTHAAAAAQQPAEPQLLQVLVKALASEEVLGVDHAGVQAQLLIVVENLMSWMPPAAVTEVRQQLYLILLQLHGAATAAAAAGAGAAADGSSTPAAAGPPAAASGSNSSSNSSSQAGRAVAVMQRLAETTGLAGGASQLAQAHAQQLLPQLTADVGKWGSGSQHLLTFTSLMQTAGPECLSGLLPQVAQVGELCDGMLRFVPACCWGPACMRLFVQLMRIVLFRDAASKPGLCVPVV